MDFAYEWLKLALAGMMVMVELLGVNDSSGLVLNYAKTVGIPDYHHVQEVKNTEVAEFNPPIKSIALPTTIPYLDDNFSYPVVDARSAVVVDMNSGAVLYEKNIDERRAMASTTKLMTAIVVLDNLKTEQIVTVDYEDTLIEPMKMYLTAGERISVDSLMKALLIPSYNDAALVLARAAGEGEIDKFVEMMNQKALVMGLKNTHFANSHGLDAPEHYSSARDMALIARYALNFDYIADIVATDKTMVYSESGNAYNLSTTNELFDSYLDVRGVKTGFTDEAGQVLITRAYNDEGQDILCVVMNSPDRFQESKSLIDWTFRVYYWD